MKTIKILYVAVLFLCVSCNQPVKWEYHSSEAGFKIELPDYMSQTEGESTVDIQYSNIFKNIACAVSAQKKDTASLNEGYRMLSLQEYDESLMASYKEGQTIKSEKITPIKISGLNARLHDFVMLESGVDLHLVFAVVEGKHSFYKIAISVEEKNKDKYGNEIKRIIGSFREL